MLDKYYKGKSFKENSERAKPALSDSDIRKIIKGKNEDEIYGGSSFCDHKFIDSINVVLEDLHSKNYISLVKDKRWPFIYSKVYLNKEKVIDICKEIHYTPVDKTEKQMLDILNKFKDVPALSKFVEQQISNINNHKSVKYCNGNTKEDFIRFYNILLGVKAVLSQKDEIYIRNLSADLYNDSKVFESIIKPICKIITEYSDSDEVKNSENDTEILEIFNIIKNPTYIYLKGVAEIEMNSGGTYILKNNTIGLPSYELKDIKRIIIQSHKIYTIENLTAFHDERLDGFMIYLAGYPNNSKIELLKKIDFYNQDKEYFHYGDIDSGGFYIFKQLSDKTGIKFKLFRMNIDILYNYQDRCKKLTEHDKVRLKSILTRKDMSMFHEVSLYMLEHNCKLEQETLYH